MLWSFSTPDTRLKHSNCPEEDVARLGVARRVELGGKHFAALLELMIRAPYICHLGGFGENDAVEHPNAPPIVGVQMKTGHSAPSISIFSTRLHRPW